MVKKGTPPDVLATLAAAFDRIAAKAEWQRFMTTNMQAPLHLSAQAMQSKFVDEVKTRRDFLKAIGVTK
jgi:tripartite-type tricarboxylate transporter receptor subunit TctC